MSIRKAGATLDTLVRGLDCAKHAMEPGIDKALLITGANVASIYGLSELIEHTQYSDATNAMIMLLGGAAMAAGNYAIWGHPRSKPTRGLTGRVNRAIDRVRPLSWLKSGTLAAALAVSARGVAPYAQQIAEDFGHPIERAAPAPQTGPPAVRSAVSALRPPIYDRLGYLPAIEYNFGHPILSDKFSTAGRLQRTLRWEPIYRAIEEKYGLPRNTLGGLIMEESCGDPVQPNCGGDGGFGVVHVQGTTATGWGLRIHGSSNRASDRDHGREICEMLEQCNYDPQQIQRYDERAHLIKVLDTAARIVATGRQLHGSWDYGIQYYRAPGRVGKNTGWRYMMRVHKWRAALSDGDAVGEAMRDFGARNGQPYIDYQRKWHAMNDNWGLETYKNASPDDMRAQASRAAKRSAD